jgi:hypothetical protein
MCDKQVLCYLQLCNSQVVYERAIMPFQATWYCESDFVALQAAPITLHISAHSMDIPLLKSFNISISLHSGSVTLFYMRFDVTEYYYFIFDVI